MNARVGFYLAVIFVVGVLIWGLIVDRYFPLAFGLAVIGMMVAAQMSALARPSTGKRSRRDKYYDFDDRDENPAYNHLPSNVWYDPDD